MGREEGNGREMGWREREMEVEGERPYTSPVANSCYATACHY